MLLMEDLYLAMVPKIRVVTNINQMLVSCVIKSLS